ncbi:MAG: arginine--tRNA ligase, partial [Patescibacteria group bacterium]
MKKNIQKIVEKALLELKDRENWEDFEMPKIEVAYAKDEKFGDYSTNIAMILAGKFRKAPMEIAENIKDEISKIQNADLEKVEVVSPGYINFTLANGYFGELLKKINKEKENFGNSPKESGEKYLVEFVSCNPTGPIHLGNGRGGPIGDILANVLEKTGAKVEREFYINDFGNQINVLGHSILKDQEAQYRGDYIDELSDDLDKSLDDPMRIGNWGANKILEKFIKPTAEKSGIVFDNWFSEKKLHDEGKVEEIIDRLKSQNLVYEKDNALWYKSTEFGDDKDRVMKKSDGKYTYLAVDFAYHKDKLERGFNKLIDIMGADHFKETEVVKNFVEKILGAENKISYILSQIVRVLKDGKEIKMSKRKGVYFALDDLIDEVGKDAVRFIFASYAPSSHINFDMNLAKEKSEKNPVYYVQYAHARIASILEKASVISHQSSAELNLLTDEKELSLMRELAKFPELVE